MNIDLDRLEPAYDFDDGGQYVQLHTGPTEIYIGGNIYKGDGEARLDLLPQAHINVYGYFQGVPIKDAMNVSLGQKVITKFSISGHPVEGFSISSGGDATTQEFNIKWCPKSEPVNVVGDESTKLTRVIFHIFNFLDLWGNRKFLKRSETTGHTLQHVDLNCDEWKIELESRLSTQENIRLLKEEGGYRLTHIGAFSRTDGTSFTGQKAVECLTALRYFLSFAKGGWCEPICAVGFDAARNRVWESWSSPSEPWNNPLSWFDPSSGSQLTTLFPGFMNKWTNDDWHEALHEVIYWYLNANHSSRGIDAGIILTQAALERLSYEYSVKENRLLTIKGFKDLWASDKFRLFFSSIKIPLDITNATPILQGFASSSQLNWIDAPQALTEIRNSLVHPEHKHRDHFESAYYEAWNLGLWYLEMGILAVCGYSGTYWNRLKQRWAGQTEDVPWQE